MALIQATSLRRTFRKPDKPPGLRGSFQHLIRRRYNDVVAVDGIDLEVHAGEAVAYVGPNGAGKSTTVKLLTGILVPTSGEVRVDGIIPHRNRIENARRIGVVFGQRTQLWWDLTVRDSLELLRDMHGLSEAQYARSLDRLVEALGIEKILTSTARTLSLGQRMRADLAAALLHEPSIVYLDEPTIGLDIVVKDRIRTFVKDLIDQGTTVMLTTHDLGDIEDICRRMVIIDDGRIVHDGNLAEVLDRYARLRTMYFTLAESLTSTSDLEPRLPGAALSESREGLELSVQFDPASLSAGQVLTAVQDFASVSDIRIKEPAIEDVVRAIYAGQLQERTGQELDGPEQGAERAS